MLCSCVNAAFCTKCSAQLSINCRIYEACSDNVRYELMDCSGQNFNLLKDILFYEISGYNLCKINGKQGIYFDLGHIKVYHRVIDNLHLVCKINIEHV